MSIRSPIKYPYGADILSRKFSGDGRFSAAGINKLEIKDLEKFKIAFIEQFSKKI